jgi:hypothetical chaperone protein
MLSGMTRFIPELYAIDFGTSNSLLSAASRDGCSEPVPLDPDAPDPTVMRSVIFFAPGQGWFFGRAAIAEYARQSARGRLLRSIKKYLPDASFSSTRIGEHRLALEDLIGFFLRALRERANRFFEADVTRVVLGRPARFSADDAADQLAERRLIAAAERAGFSEAVVYPEPLAAARDFRRTLKRDQLVLVADLGAGTSDFTVLRLRQSGYSASDVLAVGGVSVAGDAFDSAIMSGHVARHFGAEVRYKVPFGSNVLGMPRSLLQALCSPADAALLERREVQAFLRDVRHGSLSDGDKHAIDRLITFSEDCLGFAVFQAIEHTKCELSSAASAPFSFDYPSIEIDDLLSREQFERLAETPQAALLGALDDTVARAGVQPSEIDCVCLTGGTAKIPGVLAALERRFGRDRILPHRAFHSVALGLAEHARTLL